MSFPRLANKVIESKKPSVQFQAGKRKRTNTSIGFIVIHIKNCDKELLTSQIEISVSNIQNLN